MVSRQYKGYNIILDKPSSRKLSAEFFVSEGVEPKIIKGANVSILSLFIEEL